MCAVAADDVSVDNDDGDDGCVVNANLKLWMVLLVVAGAVVDRHDGDDADAVDDMDRSIFVSRRRCRRRNAACAAHVCSHFLYSLVLYCHCCCY